MKVSDPLNMAINSDHPSLSPATAGPSDGDSQHTGLTMADHYTVTRNIKDLSNEELIRSPGTVLPQSAQDEPSLGRACGCLAEQEGLCSVNKW